VIAADPDEAERRRLRSAAPPVAERGSNAGGVKVAGWLAGDE
jgi:hypothetical protein